MTYVSVQFSLVAQSCPALCDPMNCSTSGLPVHYQLQEFTQTHVHRVGDAIQPSWPPLGGLINKYSPELPLPLYLFPQRAIAAPCLRGEGNGNPLQYSCLENPMDGGAVVGRSPRLSDFTFTFHFHALEKEMATHSSVLACRIPGTGEPGGLPSMGSHRV